MIDYSVLKVEFRRIPNLITLLRILLIPFLYYFAFSQQKILFVLFLTLAGLSDFFDGFIARKLHQTSQFGAQFDSFADDIVNFSVLVWLWLFIPQFLQLHIVLVSIAFAFFLIFILLELLIHKKRLAMHLYSHKFTNLLLYLFIIHSLLFSPSESFFLIFVLSVILAMLEGIIIILFFKNISSDIPSLFLLLSHK